MKKMTTYGFAMILILSTTTLFSQEKSSFISKIIPNAIGLEFGLNKTKANYSLRYNSAGLTCLVQPKGVIGYDASIHLFHFNQPESMKPIFKHLSYYDLNIGVFTFNGKEDVTITTNKNTSDFSSSSFSLLYLFSQLSVHNLYHLKGTKLYLDNGIGGAMNFRLKTLKNEYNKTTVDFQNYEIGRHSNFPLGIQLYYNFGIGYQINDKQMIIPNIKVPFFGLHRNFNDFRPTTQWFSTFYSNTSFSLKYVYKL